MNSWRDGFCGMASNQLWCEDDSTSGAGVPPRAPEPIQWLKQYSSYLTPSRGILSTDTWTAVAIWLRNTILNQVPILMAFAAGFFLLHLLIPQPIKDSHTSLKEDLVFGIQGWWISGLLLSLYALGSVYDLSRNLYLQEQRAVKGEEHAGRSSHQWSGCAMGDSSVAGMLHMVELLGADAFGSRINSILVANRFFCNFDFGDCRGCDLFRWRMSSAFQSISRRWLVGKSRSVDSGLPRAEWCRPWWHWRWLGQ